MSNWLAEKLLKDRRLAKERENARKAAYVRDRDQFDPFAITNWRVVAPPDADVGYLPQTPMRLAKDGFRVFCKACGSEFESKGLAYCQVCLELPVEQRRQMSPAPRTCKTCNQPFQPRSYPNYCSESCRQEALKLKKNEKNAAAVSNSAEGKIKKIISLERS